MAKRADNQANPNAARKRRVSPLTVTMVVMGLVGAGIIAYPTVSDWWNSYHQSRAIATYVAAVQDMSPEQTDALLAAAAAYNEDLRLLDNRFEPTDAQLAEYDGLLDVAGNGVMGYVQVSAIGVDLPIYHGVDESVLQVAIGHIPGTSLPVGGEGTHAVISGHRGLPSARLFTDLDQLVEGDVFTITVLDRTLTYQVDQIRIVLPEDMSDLSLEPQADYVTLVTCTPYGVNTHRLLVRGHRIGNILDADTVVAEAQQVPRYLAILAVGVPMLAVFLVGMLVYYQVKRPARARELAAESLRAQVRAQAAASAGAGDEAVAGTAAGAGAEAAPKPEGAADDAPQPEGADPANGGGE